MKCETNVENVKRTKGTKNLIRGDTQKKTLHPRKLFFQTSEEARGETSTPVPSSSSQSSILPVIIRGPYPLREPGCVARCLIEITSFARKGVKKLLGSLSRKDSWAARRKLASTDAEVFQEEAFHSVIILCAKAREFSQRLR